jgi:phage terminase large subunit GpA-like protein
MKAKTDPATLKRRWLTGVMPPESITIWEHSAKYVKLSKKISSFAGFYNPKLNPLLNVVMHLLGPNSRVESTVLTKGTQCGGTLIVMLFATFVANNCPDPVMIVVSDEDERDEYYHKLNEFLDCCIPLRPKLKPLKFLNKTGVIQIPGSQIYISTATVARSLRGKHIRYLICSEISNWIKNCQGQGDPYSIAKSRTDTYEGRRKIYTESTPTDDLSNIIREIKKSKNQLTIYWACPHCGFYQSPDFFEDVKWPETTNADGEKTGDYNHPYINCQNPVCEVKKIEEKDKPLMLADFRLGPIPWIEREKQEKALSKNSKKRIHRPLYLAEDLLGIDDLDDLTESAGIWYNPIQSPLGFKSWNKIVKNHLSAEIFPEEKQPFWNNDLGMPYNGNVSSFKASVLMVRAENYSRKPLPPGCHLITASVDVNGSWLAVEVVGWGKNKESWTIDYHDIAHDPSGPVAWRELDEYLKQTYEHCSGSNMRISAVAIDSGYLTQQVAEYVNKNMGNGRNIFAIRGSGTFGRPIIDKKPKEYSKEKLTFYYVGTNTAKDTLAAWLKVDAPGACYCHFGRFLQARYFEEMASEKLESPKNLSGARRKWVKVPGKRNEAWDCRIYNLAALEFLLQLKDLNKICEIGEKKYRESGRANTKAT